MHYLVHEATLLYLYRNQDTPVDDNEQERDGFEATSSRKRNRSSAQGGGGPNSKKLRIITEEAEYNWSQPQDIASYTQMIIQKNISQKKISKR